MEEENRMRGMMQGGCHSSSGLILDDDHPRDHCGVFAIISPNKHVAPDIYDGLIALQHRGQESAGMTILQGKKFHTIVGMGLASTVFENHDVTRIEGQRGIGHVRYSTTGTSDIMNAQPLVLRMPKISLAIAFNGNILNYCTLKEVYEERGYDFATTTDTELIGFILAEYLSHGIEHAVKRLMDELIGSYSLVVMTNRGEIYGIRDPHGFKPLVLGVREKDYILASEIPALDAIGAHFVREVSPGELVALHDEGKGKILSSSRRSHCFFEWVYFLRPDTIFEGKSSYEIRERLGKKLAELYPLNVDVVIGVPDSGRTAALGYAKQSGIPFAEGLIKNRYIWRTFILPNQAKRKSSVALKLNPIKSVIKGKRVALVDDSIVRGTTMQRIVSLLRAAGAKEVHVLSSAPPIIAPCKMGIDFPTYKELIAEGKTIEQIKECLGADGVYYMTIDGLVDAIGLPKETLCLACVTNQYPFDFPEQAKRKECERQ